MNPAKSYAHLFSPLGGEGGENYRAPGQLTFLRAPHVALETAALKAHGARYAFVGVPFDEGNVGKPGSEDGPREFRIASQEYLSYWFEFGVDLNGLAVDCGDVPMPKVNPDSARERIYRAVTTVLKAGVTPIIVGGDRSISIQAARALSDHIGAGKKMGCLHFGAHLDLADSWAGEKLLSTCALARITELPNLDSANVAHIGARNSMNPKDYIDLAKARNIRFYPMFEIYERGIDAVTREAVAKVWGGTDAQYLSFNFNVMDASAAPGVTATEPGGLESREMVRGRRYHRRAENREPHRRDRARAGLRRERHDLASGGVHRTAADGGDGAGARRAGRSELAPVRSHRRRIRETLRSVACFCCQSGGQRHDHHHRDIGHGQRPVVLPTGCTTSSTTIASRFSLSAMKTRRAGACAARPTREPTSPLRLSAAASWSTARCFCWRRPAPSSCARRSSTGCASRRATQMRRSRQVIAPAIITGR